MHWRKAIFGFYVVCFDTLTQCKNLVLPNLSTYPLMYLKHLHFHIYGKYNIILNIPSFLKSDKILFGLLTPGWHQVTTFCGSHVSCVQTFIVLHAIYSLPVVNQCLINAWEDSHFPNPPLLYPKKPLNSHRVSRILIKFSLKKTTMMI